jgi:hypothetical protein
MSEYNILFYNFYNLFHVIDIFGYKITNNFLFLFLNIKNNNLN